MGFGHTEPSYVDRVSLENVAPPRYDPNPEGIHNGVWDVAARCPNCTRSLGVGTGVDAIDFSGEDDMIFAFGPENDYSQSNALDAPLRRHTAYGHFRIDLGAASVTTPDDDLARSVGVPPLGNSSDHSFIVGSISNDNEPSSAAHAAIMCFAFLIMFPAGVIAARIFNKVRWHAAIQAGGLLLVIIGVAIGIYMSKYYNRVSDDA